MVRNLELSPPVLQQWFELHGSVRQTLTEALHAVRIVANRDASPRRCELAVDGLQVEYQVDLSGTVRVLALNSAQAA